METVFPKTPAPVVLKALPPTPQKQRAPSNRLSTRPSPAPTPSRSPSAPRSNVRSVVSSVPEVLVRVGRSSDSAGLEAQNRSMPRRLFLVATGSAALWLDTRRDAVARHNDRATVPNPQPREPREAAFIDRAFEMRQLAVDLGDQAYGAIIVRDGLIIGQSPSRVVQDHDPTGHAEMSAIRDATRRLTSRDLSGATMYSSSRPCPMCEAAAYWARIGAMIHGRNANSAGAPQLCR